MSFDALIRGAVVAGTGAPTRLDIGVVDGLIAAIGPELAGPATEEIDAAGLYLLPGVIDGHVHMNEPGRADWEGFQTGTRALAAGGATAAIDMPLNAHPPTVTGVAFDEKRRCVERSALVDIALWGGLVPGGIDAMDELADRGVVGFKAFMCSSGMDDFPGVDDLTLYEGMCRAASLGLPVAVHAESEAITAGLAQRARAEGRTAIRDFLSSRPAVAELQAIARAIELTHESGCSTHVVHVSTGRGVALVAAARERGVDVTCETCPHYLVLTDEDAEALGHVAKCAPPLRPREESEALWHALADGTLPMVASDHSPAPWALKSGDDAFAAWGGISGAQTMLPLLLSEGAGARGLSLELIAAATSGYVARRFRLAGKGSVEPGADADLVLVDLGVSERLSADDLQYRHRHSPFLGRNARRARGAHTRARPDGVRRRPDRRRARWAAADANHDRNGEPMTTLSITAGPFTFRARLEEERAPKTCEAFSKLLPFEQKVIHVRWSGESTWIPLGDFDVGVGFENHTSHPAPGEILLYPGGYSETEILLPYGGCMFSSIVGQLAGNHFLTVFEGNDNLRPLGEMTLWQGAQDIVFAAE